MGKKRHIKVFVIADAKFRKTASPEAMLEYDLALDCIRARCFSSSRLSQVSDAENTVDWQMKTALTEAMIKTCDAVAVVGNDITREMLAEIRLAQKAGKPICVSDGLKSEAIRNHTPFCNTRLSSICKDVLRKANGEQEKNKYANSSRRTRGSVRSSPKFDV